MIRWLVRVARAALAVSLASALAVGAMTWIATNATRRWFERDTASRAALAVRSATDPILRQLAEGDHAGAERLLERIARDERILAAISCLDDGTPFSATSLFPPEFSCAGLVTALKENRGEPWHGLQDTSRGPVLLSVIPLSRAGTLVGVVGLVHDMTYVDRRERSFLWFGFALFCLFSVSGTFAVLSSRRALLLHFAEDVRAILAGRPADSQFDPLRGDLRELLTKVASESDAGGGDRWNAARLRETLKRRLHGEKVIILANREPYIHENTPEGAVRVIHPASGLVTALEPIMRACSGTWIAHGSGSADRTVVDRNDRIRVPPDAPSYLLKRVWLSPEEERGYYYGFSNEGLWPLCHLAHARPEFRHSDWKAYREVNQKFAYAVADEATVDDPVILVQDYHFALAPRMIRELLPRATILTFWHIPWPAAQRFGMCPWRTEILEGLLGSSIVGFHTRQHSRNFLDTVDRYLEARVDRESDSVSFWRRETRVRPYPISIEWPNPWAESAPPAESCRRAVRAQLGLPPDTLLGLGVDRLDYTKGIEERLGAVERLLEKHPRLRGKFVFVQMSAPSRATIDAYRDLALRVSRAADRVNTRFGTPGYQPVILLTEHHEPPAVFSFMRAADLCYVSSLEDGMNLVAKEFVASRDDERGVLVLSEFTGASRELTEALIVNPYDLDQASDALLRALEMPLEEQTARMRAMRALVGDYNVYRWAGRMLIDSARLQQSERLSERFRFRRARST